MYKQFNKNNLVYILALCVFFLILKVDNIAFCAPVIFSKFYNNIENYFLNLTFEKAISDPVELTKSIGWVSVGAIGCLHIFEWIWNVRLIGSKFLYNYTPFGLADDAPGKLREWFGFRNTAGPLRSTIESVPYEQILPLYFIRTCVFPLIFVNTEKIKRNHSSMSLTKRDNIDTTILNESPSEISPSHEDILPVLPSIDSLNIQTVTKPEIIYQERIVKEIEIQEVPVDRIVEVDKPYPVIEYVDRPVIEYRDREQLLELREKVDNLIFITNENNLHQIGLHQGYPQLKEELLLLVNSNQKPNVILTQIQFFRETEMSIPFITFTYRKHLPLGTLFSIKQQQYNTNLVIPIAEFPYPFLLNVFTLFADYNEDHFGIHTTADPRRIHNSPTIVLTYSNTNLNEPQLQIDKTLVTQIFINRNMYLFNEGLKFFIEKNIQLQPFKTEQHKIAYELKKHINKKLLVKTKSTQTETLDIYTLTYFRIESFLEIKDKIALVLASREGRNFPTVKLQNAEISIKPIKTVRKNQGVEETKDSEIIGSTQTDFVSPFALGTLGVVGFLHNIPVQDLLDFIINSSNFEPLLNNPETLQVLIQLYQNNEIEAPAMLLNLKASMLPDPHSYLLPGEEIFDTDTLSNVKEQSKSYLTKNTLLYGVGLLFVSALAIGTFWYCWPSDVPISEMTNMDEIRKAALKLK